jgi:predicted small lipoprotein YifL
MTTRHRFGFLWIVFTLAGCGHDGPDVPHPVESRSDADCVKCHSRRDLAPVGDHNDKSDCAACHAVKSTGTYPALMPHKGGDEDLCTFCHQSGIAGAAVTRHIGETDCYACHKAPDYGIWPPAIGHSVTASDDASCLSCHSSVAHEDRTGCADCHKT